MRTKVGSSKRLAGLLALALIVGLVPGFFSAAYAATTLVVDDNVIGQPSDCSGTPNSTHNSVRLAVNAALDGDTVLVCPGTFTEQQIRINVNNLTIQGSGVGVTTILRPGVTSYGIHVLGDPNIPGYSDGHAGGSDGVTLRDFTMDGQRTNNTDRAFGIKVDPGADNGLIHTVAVKDFYRTGVDFNTTDNWYVYNTSSEEAVTGNGFQSTDSTDLTYENITATTNGWGGVGVFTRGEFSGSPGTSGVVFQGTNTLEAVGKNPDIYFEGFNQFDQGNPTPITYSTSPGSEVLVQASEVNFAYEGVFDDPGVPNHYYSALYTTLAEARDAATPPRWKDLNPGTIRNISTGEYYPVAPGDPVQADPGDTVTTDDGSGQPTPSNPQTTSVTTPAGGPVTITESSTHTQPLPNDYSHFGDEVSITANPSPNPNPLVITFKFDASTLNPPDPNSITVRRNGVEVLPCAGGHGTSAIPDPCVDSQGVDGNGDLVIVVFTTAASIWDFITPAAVCTISGTPGPDELHGTPGDDVICGLGGDDKIYGEGGLDELHGQGGNDTLYGQNGGDLMFGGDGNDDMFGGNGGDEMYGGLDDDRMWGGFGDEFFSGGDGHDLMVGRFGSDEFDGGPGDDTVLGGDGNDLINVHEGNNDVYAGIGSDIITAGAGNDRLRGGGGSDSITAGDGNNEILAGDGNNFVFSGTGNDYVDAGLGNDFIDVDGGNDSVFAGHGTNTILLGEGDNYSLSGTGPDFVTSGTGVDKIETGLGDDKVFSSDGDDALYLGDGANFANAGDGNNYILGGPSVDTIVSGTGNDRIDAEGGNNVVNAGDGNNAIFSGNGNNNVTTGSGADFFSLGLGADIIFSGAGNDIVFAGRGTNDINGEAGDDYLVGGEDNDDFDGGPDTDTCDAGSLGFDTQVNCENLVGTFP